MAPPLGRWLIHYRYPFTLLKGYRDCSLALRESRLLPGCGGSRRGVGGEGEPGVQAEPGGDIDQGVEGELADSSAGSTEFMQSKVISDRMASATCSRGAR